MDSWLMLLPIVFPLLGGACLPLLPWKSKGARQIFVGSVVLVNAVMTLVLLWLRPTEAFTILHFTDTLSLSFHIDGLSMVFAGLVALLWPLATWYAFEYMRHEERQNLFFSFYTMTFGVTVGIAFAANYMTLYMFYELLTLVTIPLVMHSMEKKAIIAARKYMIYSIAGAAFAFIGLIFSLNFGEGGVFRWGGMLSSALVAEHSDLLLLVYVLAFLGFGVKAAVFPFHAWLPAASVAPTPVTALLHAVAVVKAGVFAMMRLTYYTFGIDFLQGSWAQYVVLGFVIVTIVFGSARALKEPHWKRRLAYSTVSNLSYVAFGVALMSPAGMIGAMCHMVFHGVMKIVSFFAAGAVMHQTGREQVSQLNGMGKAMPITFVCFTVSSLGLVGIPPVAGFFSKWNLAVAAVQTEHITGYLGLIALMLSAILTAIYMLAVVVRAYAYQPTEGNALTGKHDPNAFMLVPMVVLSIAMVLLGIFVGPLLDFFSQIVQGIL